MSSTNPSVQCSRTHDDAAIAFHNDVDLRNINSSADCWKFCLLITEWTCNSAEYFEYNQHPDYQLCNLSVQDSTSSSFNEYPQAVLIDRCT